MNEDLEVLIIDEDAISVFLHKFMLKQAGFLEPLNVLNAEEAINFIYKNVAPDRSFLILLDINMPGMNAWEFLYQLDDLHISDNIFVVIVTSSVKSEDKHIAKTFKNIIDYIEKPLRLVDCEKLKTIQTLEKYFN